MTDITGLREDKRPQSSRIVHALLDRLEAAEAEALEEARLNGMGSEREAKHLAQIAALEKERDAMRAELDALLAWKEEAERQEPVGVLHVGSWYGEELQDWEFEADQTACDRLNEAHQHKEASLSLYALPVPAPSVPDERAAFDAWRHDGAWCRADDAGEWEAWQARAKLAAAPKPEETK